ncbi:protein pxr1-like [Limosa lapponica baueri]|uniref:Protein pxr1-like n=1 Tax=Limosa lapponica baueri TaxID=1758121 RepID=A0A2I0U093_LIMLA|nr:protein pxr1-like [Limosa lapponica baueri]
MAASRRVKIYESNNSAGTKVSEEVGGGDALGVQSRDSPAACGEDHEPTPASSKIDPLLTKAEPISDSGSASGITYLRWRKNAVQQQPEREVRICERNSPADTKDSEEGAGGGAPGVRAEIPLQPVVKTMVRQAVPLQPMEGNGGTDIHLQPMEDPTLEQVDTRRRL